ncbi:MAG: hypothetical protein HY038_11360 [Nitrospirae bacterium]|nr:hypothetical protein [Nitrospirota bacterium]
MRASLCYSRRLQYIGTLLSLCLVVTGCSMFYGWSKIHKSAKGSIYLTEVADWSFEASHPAVIDQTTILKVVKGVVADEAMKMSANMPASGSKSMRVFSDEDAEFLAPLLAQGLSQARPEQIVGFTVSLSAGSGTEPTAGTLYVHQGSIYLTIAPSQGKKASGFMPSSVARIEKAPSYAAAGAAGALSMVIDYQALAKAPAPGAIPVAAAPKLIPVSPTSVAPIAKTTPKQEATVAAQTLAVSSPPSSDPVTTEMSNDELLNKKLDELRQMREANKMKESEIAVLKRELDWTKQELRERTAEVKAIRANKVSGHSAPKKRTAEASPIR